MVKITYGISKNHLDEVYSHPKMQNISHDYLPAEPIRNPNVHYYSAWVDYEFVGAYMVITSSHTEYEVHMLLLPKVKLEQRKLSKLMAKELFKHTDRLCTTVLDGMETAKNHLAKIGFHLEGIKRKAFQKNGVKVDAYIYGLLKSEFKD